MFVESLIYWVKLDSSVFQWWLFGYLVILDLSRYNPGLSSAFFTQTYPYVFQNLVFIKVTSK